MKLVKESLYEIKKERDTSGLSTIGIGKPAMIKKWAAENFDEYYIEDDIIYPEFPDEYPSPKMILSNIIPDYIKIQAIKPFEWLNIGDTVINIIESDIEMFVKSKIPYDTPNIRNVLDKIDRTAYDRLQNLIYHGINFVHVEYYNDYNSTISDHIFAYDIDLGVVSLFIYNGDKF